MRGCHRGLDAAALPAPHRAFPLFFVLEAGPSVLPAGRVSSLDTNSRAADTNSLYSECWKDSMVQRKLSGDTLNRKKTLLRNGASSAEGAAASPVLGTCIQAHPSVLQGDPLGPAPATSEVPDRVRRVLLPVGARPAPCWGRQLGTAWAAAASCSCGCSSEQPASLSGVRKHPSTRVMCISFSHLENLIPLLEICCNAVLPEPHVEFYYALNTNYFRSSCSNLCPKWRNKGLELS